MPSSNNQDTFEPTGIKPVSIKEELQDSFLDYAMSVVVSRAIPDIRDGLKPVHRRIMYTMYTLGYWYNKPYHKSVRVVGEVLGRYHPHGDQAVYNSMVNMVQEFKERYPLLDGQGNWGSVDGDNAAAMRYTEVRMQKIAGELLADLDKDTVPWVPNFDDSTMEPSLLPSRIPNLLVNGTTGIAVGMATSIPPHNLTEVVDGLLTLLENPELTDDELFQIIPAPDFPTGGIIMGRAGIVRAYKTGRGKVIVRGVVDIIEDKKQSRLIITELPYVVNKAALAIKIANLVNAKVVDGISNIRDESSKKGMRLVIELKRGEIPGVTLNQLYKHTPLQSSHSILMLGLLDNRPLIFTLRELLLQFLYHRREVITRRTIYDLQKAKDREHILAGFIIALQNIDEVITTIKACKTPQDAIAELNKRFLLSFGQCKAILEMKLQRLTGLEQEKIYAEMEDLKKKILGLQSILDNPEILKEEIKKELQEVKAAFGDARRSKIAGAVDILSEADLIPEEDVVITLTRKGYIKRVPLTTYGVQHRGGKGKMGMAKLEGADDIVLDMFVGGSHDELLFFTNLGRVYSLQIFEVPEGSRISKGRAIVNLLPLVPGEKVVKLLHAKDLKDQQVVMLSKKGLIKRTNAQAFAKIRKTGIRAVTLKEGDELVFCRLSSGKDTIVIATKNGQGIRFKEAEVRSMGRQASGVIGIRLKKSDEVVGMEVVDENGNDLLFATENGYGKRVRVKDFRIAHRGGVGVRTIPTTKRNGPVIGLAIVGDDSEILLIDLAGKIIRLSTQEVRTMGRQAKGVRLIKLDKGQKLAAVVAFTEENGDDQQESSGGTGGSKAKKDMQLEPGNSEAEPFQMSDQSIEPQVDTEVKNTQHELNKENADQAEPEMQGTQTDILSKNDSDEDPFLQF